MKPRKRRKERDSEVIEFLGSRYSQVHDLSYLEEDGVFLEGTGSMVLDRNFTATQLAQLEKNAKVLHTDLSVIENLGGGSARCMIAELF